MLHAQHHDGYALHREHIYIGSIQHDISTKVPLHQNHPSTDSYIAAHVNMAHYPLNNCPPIKRLRQTTLSSHTRLTSFNIYMPQRKKKKTISQVTYRAVKQREQNYTIQERRRKKSPKWFRKDIHTTTQTKKTCILNDEPQPTIAVDYLSHDSDVIYFLSDIEDRVNNIRAKCPTKQFLGDIQSRTRDICLKYMRDDMAALYYMRGWSHPLTSIAISTPLPLPPCPSVG